MEREGGKADTGDSEKAQPRWHSIAVEDVLADLETDADSGLTAAEAESRLGEHGPNRLPEERRTSLLVRFIKHFHNVLIYILLVAAVFTAILGEWIDTFVILAVVLANALLGFIQEGKAEKAMEGLRKLLSLEAKVVRDGERLRVDAENLVPGDLVSLKSGDVVPADIRIISANNAGIEEAALTGESQPVSKSTDAVDDDAVLGDRTSMGFSGTLVRRGRLRGIVVATGKHTEIGRIGGMVAGVEKPTTPLLEKISGFGKQLSVAIIGMALLLFLFGAFMRDYTTAQLFLIVVSFAVAAIPEGLPAILTITLALGVQRMGRRNAIVRKLPAVETLGSVTVICSDKTGTITRNEMTVGRLVTEHGSYEIEGSGYNDEGEIRLENDVVDADDDPLLAEIARAGVLCNDSVLRPAEESGVWVLEGEPTEGALLVLGMKAGYDWEALQKEYSRLEVIPFESENRLMVTLNEDPSGESWIYVKGAPERLFDICRSVRLDEGESEFRPDEWRERIDEHAAAGFRMLAIAAKKAGAGQNSLEPTDLEEGLVLLGVAGLTDPPRPEAISAIAECRRAGIRVKMITGDHALTARSIAGEVGIGADDGNVLTGKEIEGLSDEELEGLIRETDIIARSSPEHKLRIVKALQAQEEVVAMTGDGVNDAPALKQADIGVAMGIKGSEASKRASEMVLADDNFATIERAVEEGRTVYDNIRKAILFILPTNGAEALLVVSAVALAFSELPITPVQILWVNMVTAVTLALALAFEPMEPGIMERPPRSRGESILSGYLLWRIAFVAVIVSAAAQLLFLRELGAGRDPELARTVTVNVLVAGQVFYLFNSRFILGASYRLGRLLSNRAALLAVGGLIVLQAAFTYVPVFQLWFGTAGLAATDWAWVVGAGFVVFVLVELEKGVVRRIRKAR